MDAASKTVLADLERRAELGGGAERARSASTTPAS